MLVRPKINRTMEAIQWFPGVFIKGVQEITEEDGTVVALAKTMEGFIRVTAGSWVITDQKNGYVSVTSDENFRHCYESIKK